MSYTVINEWSCGFARKNKEDSVNDHLNSIYIQDVTNIRNCYFCGRTNVFVLHKTFIDRKKGCYEDFTNLHPDIFKV